VKWVGIAITILAAGCVPGPTINSGNTGASAAAASSAGASSGASGSGTGMTSSGEAATSSTTASGASSSGGTATGFVGSSSAGSTTGIPISPPIDGGYVFCSGFGGEDAGSWMCTPGTYFCDWNGYPGYCFQCRSDADCSDPHLPTYDPRKPRCDLSSGIFGYQNFCQQCLSDADCASNLAAPFCDVSPTLSAGFSHTIDNLGFESCDRTETDCRADGGPPCGLNALCNADSGACEVRSLACTSDADCVGLFADTNHTMAYCFDGACTQYAGGGYPGPCNTNAECGNPGGLFDGGMVCSFGLCQCTDDSQCQGATPVCQNFGSTSVCGCETDQQCGDGGLHCFYGDTGGSFCGVSCNSPAAPPCSTDKPNCNQDSGTCGYCTADSDCQTVFSPAGNACGP